MSLLSWLPKYGHIAYQSFLPKTLAILEGGYFLILTKRSTKFYNLCSYFRMANLVANQYDHTSVQIVFFQLFQIRSRLVQFSFSSVRPRLVQFWHGERLPDLVIVHEIV